MVHCHRNSMVHCHRNSYAYVANDPVNATDPTGQSCRTEPIPGGLRLICKRDVPPPPLPPGLTNFLNGQAQGAKNFGAFLALHSMGAHDAANALLETTKLGNILKSEAEKEKTRQSKPTNAPPGTKPIDKAKGTKGIDRGKIHTVKKQIGARPNDWVGVTPDGEIITTDPETGEAVHEGHVSDFY